MMTDNISKMFEEKKSFRIDKQNLKIVTIIPAT